MSITAGHGNILPYAAPSILGAIVRALGSMPRMVRRAAMALAVAVLCLPAQAQSIAVQAGSQQAFVDEPIRVTVTIENAPGFEGPFVGTTGVVQAADSLEIKRLPGEQTFTQRANINGRSTERTVVGISYEIIPRRAGDFTVPPFSMKFEGRTYETRPLQLRAVVSEAGDLLLARVRCTPATLFVGQRGRLDLRVAVRRYTDAQLGITLDERSMWSMLVRATESWGVFQAPLQQLEAENKRPRGDLEVIDGKEYIVFTIAKEFEPITTGNPSVGDARIRINYPMRLSRGFDGFFGSQLDVSESRPISVVPSFETFEVLTPPEGGRPASWNGAVGNFTVDAVAKPIEAAVGDPMTITLRATDRSGTASLDGLLAPSLRDQPAFLRDFRIPPEAASGVIDGRSKVFTLSVRPLNDRVAEIPPIEFAFFDPSKGAYEVMRTKAIPISVKPSAVVRVPAPEERGSTASEGTALTRVESGILANAPTPVAATVQPRPALLAAAMAVAPIALGIVYWRRQIALADARDPTARRRREAYAALLGRLAAPGAPESAGPALLSYIADRTGAQDGALARRDATDALREAGIDDRLVARIDELLRRCERARYADETVEVEEVRELAGELERAAWAAPRAQDRNHPRGSA